ncbi:MAG: hypothetical protein EOO13_06860 [Chitinophagaceae bacterium]|nr:MAG: hypothetical protein EOO13_06860 [Chitinophagaceae bacterium]
MSDQNTTVDSLNMNEFDKPKLPTGLNVLTILTFIGCALQLLGVVFGFMGAKKNLDEKDSMMAKMTSGEMPSFMKSMMPDMKHYEEMVTKSYENRIPILALGLIAVFLCFYGALQMRKLKKQGYLLYVVGELLPLVSSALFLGAFAFSGVGFAIGAGIMLLFILLYTMQRKHLVY